MTAETCRGASGAPPAGGPHSDDLTGTTRRLTRDLQKKADQCRRLARLSTNDMMCTTLERLAEDYDRQAQEQTSKP